MKLVACQFEFTFPRPALVMGIVNVTPDSFSDGGCFFDTAKAVAHALELEAQGAEIIDVGGESTRPLASPVEAAEELRRVLPVIEQLHGRVKVPISIDTRKPEVAKAAVAAGASIVNDIGANRNDNEMGQVVAESGAAYVCMHMQGTPETMQVDPIYTDVVAEVRQFFEEQLARLSDCGVPSERVIIDPGIGFGKRPEHNLALLANLQAFGSLERPVIVGASRKSFMGRLLGAGVGARMPASLACACMAVEAGAQIIRAHDGAETVQAVRMTEAILRSKTS